MKFAGKWKELENIILSEVTQTQKDKHERKVPKNIQDPFPMDKHCQFMKKTIQDWRYDSEVLRLTQNDLLLSSGFILFLVGETPPPHAISLERFLRTCLRIVHIGYILLSQWHGDGIDPSK
ncbi:hypothetical protein STEG23_014668 [Scotinomys teguina]